MRNAFSKILTGTLVWGLILSPTAWADQTGTSGELPLPLPSQSAGTSATQNLQNVQQQQNSNSTMYYLGSAAAGAFAVWQGIQCAGPGHPPTNCALAAAGVVAAALLAMSGGKTQQAGNGARNKAAQLSQGSAGLGSDGSGTTGTGTTGATDAGTSSSQLLTSLPPTLASKLATAGVALDPATGTITTPDGQTYDAGSLAAAATNPGSSSLPNSGLAGSIKDEMKSAMDEAAKKMGDSGSDEYVGGGARAASPVTATAETMTPTRALASAVNRDPAQVAGLKTLYNGEPIGVASDSIFGIVDRRYNEKIKSGSFNP